MSNNLERFLIVSAIPKIKNCLIHHEIKMKRTVFDEQLLMFEYYCKKCNTKYSSRALNIMEIEKKKND